MSTHVAFQVALCLALSGCTGDAGEDNSQPVQLDVEAIASATITGEADWLLSLDRSLIADIDDDGHLDIILHYLADDKDDTADTSCSPGLKVDRLGVVYGPLGMDQTPTTIVEGRVDPLRTPANIAEVYDFDGDGALELSVSYLETDAPAPAEIYDLPDCPDPKPTTGAYGLAMFEDPATPHTLEDGQFTTGRYPRIQDLDLDGTQDLILFEAGSNEHWWFGAPTANPSASTADAVLTFPSQGGGGLWSRIGEDGQPQTWMTVHSEATDRRFRWAERRVTDLDLAQGGALSLEAIPISLQLGDVDGDHVDDLVTLAPNEPSGTVILGGWDTMGESTPERWVEFGGSLLDSGERLDILSPGDLNGDGVNELMVRVRPDAPLSEDLACPQKSWIFLGPLTPGILEAEDADFTSEGRFVVPIGDIDGDGLDDLGFEQPGWPESLCPVGVDRQPGRVWIVTGADLVAAP